MTGVISFHLTPHLPQHTDKIAAAIQGEQQIFPWLVAQDFTSKNLQKRSVLQPLVTVPSAGLELQEPHPKRHMMPLGLISWVRTQALGWRRQEVHRCTSAVAGRAIL